MHADQVQISWPAPGQAPVSTTAVLVPYRPAELTATVPCAAVRAAASLDRPVTVLATGGSLDAGGGVLVRVDSGQASVLVNGRLVAQAVLPEAPVAGFGTAGSERAGSERAGSRSAGPDAARATGPDCGARITADGAGVEVTLAASRVRLAGEPVPEVASFRTELDPTAAAGLTVRARPVTPFATSPTGLKAALLVTQLVAVAAALALLWRRYATRGARSPRLRPRRVWWVDGGVLAVLGGWAVLGPLSDDDGFAAMIARNASAAGDQGNYYRWWNASETPFALAQHVLAPLTEVSLVPLWLRLPSTMMGVAAWFALSRGVLGAIPGLGANRARVRLAAAVCFLAGWLPYDLGVRPEPYVALGLTVLLALLLRARTPAGLGAATLVAALTMTASPSGLLVLAPIVLFAGRLRRLVGAHDRQNGVVHSRAALALLIAGIGAVGMSVVFADQTLHGVLTATRWHTEFGPSLAWTQEWRRYGFLLGDSQDGNAAKRLPVLLAFALLPVLGVALARRGDRDPRNAAAARLAGVLAFALALLWLTPSKWSHHFGVLAGINAAFLVVAAVTLVRHAREQPTHRPLDRTLLGTGLVGAALVAVAAALSFAGPNAWWQPAVYAVPWAAGPVRPLGLPLDWPVVWLVGAGTLAALVRLRSGELAARAAVAAAPGVLAMVAAGVSVAVLLHSFVAAPLVRPEGSLAAESAARLTGGQGCAVGDDIQVLPDTPGGVLAPADEGAAEESPADEGPADEGSPDGGRTALSAAGVSGASGAVLAGFAVGAGFGRYGPPEPPGVGASTYTWGSRTGGGASTGRLVSEWFALTVPRPNQELAMTVSGRTDDGNRLALEFGRTDPDGTDPDGRITSLGERAMIDQPHDDPAAPPDPAVWRSAWLPADQVPAGADRVRVLAVDAAADEQGWLAFTGPRLRDVRSLPEFLGQGQHAGQDVGPVLVNWPIAFLFPCVRDTAVVAHGVAAAPRVVLEAPGRYAGLADASTDPGVGGNFAALRVLGRVGELPSRVVGHPGLDWGSVRLVDYQVDGRRLARDRYQLTLTRVTVPGWRGDDAQFLTEGDR